MWVNEAQGIYVIKSAPGLPVKVGVTCDFSNRLRQLQNGNWNTLEAHWFSFVAPQGNRVKRNFFNSLTLASAALEKHVLRTMKELGLWVSGEWFLCDPDAAVAVIQKVGAINGFEFFGIEAAASLGLHERLPAHHLDLAERLINAELSARSALGLQ